MQASRICQVFLKILAKTCCVGCMEWDSDKDIVLFQAKANVRCQAQTQGCPNLFLPNCSTEPVRGRVMVSAWLIE